LTVWKIPHYKAFVEKEDVTQVSKIIKRGMFWALGPEIDEFEKSLAKFVGSKYCVSFNSGTSALHASLLSLNLKPKSEIIVPSFTFISTANSALMANSIPKFIDIESERFGIDPKLLDSKITNKTKAIIPVHYGGCPCKIEEIQKISKKKKLFLIEDAAEALGAKSKNSSVGTFGDLAIFSFAGNKSITTGEGGCVITDSKKYFKKLKLLRSHGRNENQNYFSSTSIPEYVQLGYNWRMSSITAALGISQLNKIKKIISMRRNISENYTKKLEKIPSIEIVKEPKGVTHTFQFYNILLPNSLIRNSLLKYLENKGIMTKVFFYPIHSTKFYKQNLKKQFLPVTENISKRILSLPLYPGMNQEEQSYVCDSIFEYFELVSK
jgi:perosamine synthetase